MTISIPPELEKFVEQQVKSGHHPDPSHVIACALSAMRDAAVLEAADVGELRRAVKEGWDDLRAGRSAPWDAEEIKAEGRRLLAETSRRKAQ
jgi:antitoxin ParD1/3/4